MSGGIRKLIFISVLLIGILSTNAWAQTIVCGEQDALNTISGPFTYLISLRGTPGTAGSVPTMSNGSFESAQIVVPIYGAVGGGVKLGCKLPGVTLTAGSGTTLLRLSGLTNAHAEIPSLSTPAYSTLIRLNASSGTITVTAQPATALCPAGSSELVTLHKNTNAHGESPAYTPPNYTTAIAQRICVGYTPSGGGGPPTDIVSTSIGISNTSGVLSGGSNSFQVGQSSPIYANAIATKTINAAATNTITENFLILCIVGQADCEAINNIDTSNPVNNNLTTLGAGTLVNILQNATNPILIAGGPFKTSPGSNNSFLNSFTSSPSVVEFPINDSGNLEAQTNAGTGVTTFGIDLSALLSTGSSSGITPFPNLASQIPYIMRVIAFSVPANSTLSGTTYSELTAGMNTLNNKATATISVSNTPGAGGAVDIVNVSNSLQNITPPASGSIPPGTIIQGDSTAIITNVTRVNPSFAGTNVQTINVWASCRTDDTTLVDFSGMPLPYSNFTTVGQACAGIDNSFVLLAAIQNLGVANIIFAGIKKATFWGTDYPTNTNPNFTSLWGTPSGAPSCSAFYSPPTPFFNTPSNWSTCPTLPGPGPLSGSPYIGTGYDAYSVGLLPIGTYRIVSASFPATADLSGTPVSEALPTTLAMAPQTMTNNFSSLTFQVVPTGTIPLTCNYNNICEPPAEDPSNCPDCQNANPGDAYLLEDITIPQRYKGESVEAIATISNKKANPSQATIIYLVRDSKGQTVPGFPDQTTYSFTGTLNAGKEVAVLPSLGMENAANPPNIVFKAGETYTLYVRVVAYNDITNDPPGSVIFDESVLGNNQAFKTFTVPEAPQTFSIPDQPWWMGILIVMGILGWMYFASKN